MESGHRLTILSGQTHLRHPKACQDIPQCVVHAAVQLSDSVPLFRDGLYAVHLSGLGAVHLVELNPKRALTSV